MSTMTRTCRVELDLGLEQLVVLDQTLAQWKTVFDEYGEWFYQNKTSRKVRAHAALYASQRQVHPDFPSALVQAARDTASEAIKSYNTRHPSKRWQKAPVSNGKTMRFDARTVSLRGQQLTYSSVAGRQKTIVTLPEWFTRKYPAAKFKAAQLGRDRHGRAYASLVFIVGEAPPKKTEGRTIGLDRGIVNPVMTSEGWSPSGREVRAKRRQHLHNRKTLQQKGTRAARKRLAQQAGREQRFMLDWNHKLSSALASSGGVARFVLEDLSFKESHQRGYSKKGRRAAKARSDWSHAQLLELLSYKAEAAGVELVFVSPAFTSQKCSCCGFTKKENRKRGRFKCGRCGFRASADWNAALNIRDKYISASQVLAAGPREGSGLETDLWREDTAVQMAVSPSQEMSLSSITAQA